ncbi:hypothetical protein [Acinetobacter sp.]|uniref:hypothetical protein n=1 Tax=Acinetobacter sp. TaxID=472 RepID=UPI003890672A
MGLWDKVKGAIIEDDGKAAVVEGPKGSPQAAQQAPDVRTTAGSGVTFQPSTSLNQDMVDMIRKQTFGRNTALTALIGAADQLTDIIPDPVMRLKAAQKTAGAGRSAKEFADAVTIHLSDVDGAEMQFGQALESKIKAEVGGLQNQANASEQQVGAMNAEIQNLQQRIAQLQQSIAEQSTNMVNLRTQAATKEAELRQADVEFKAAAAHVRNELNGHKATILSTLG